MATDIVSIFKVDTTQAVKSVQDLRNNIAEYKKRLNETQVDSAEGWAKYQETLELLKINQNALKDAMYATSTSFDQVQKAAIGASTAFDANNKLINAESISYNELVHSMANLKEAWRATTDAQERAKLGERIKSVNDQLKAFDKSIGNNQRNVGNYTSAFDNLSGSFKATAGAAGGMIAPITGATQAMKVMSATPVIGILGLLANVINSVVTNLKSSEENMRAASNAMSILSGIGDLATKTMQFLGSAVTKVANVLGDLAKNVLPALAQAADLRNSITQEEIRLQDKQREALTRNADAELAIAKLREKAADKSRYSAQERLAFLEEASKKELEIADRNKQIALMEYNLAMLNSQTTENSREQNDKLAQAYANLQAQETAYFNKQRSLNKEMAKARKDMAAESKNAVQSQIDDTDTLIKINDGWIDKLDINIQAQIEAQKALAEAQKEIDAEILADYESTYQEVNDILNAFDKEEEQRKQNEDERARAKVETMEIVYNNTLDIMDSLADILEADEDSAEKNAVAIKGLRIATATIDTIHGAIAAYMSAIESIPAPMNIPVGIAQAASVTAAGIANIAKIKSTKVGNSGDSGGSTNLTPASVSAPVITDTNITNVRNVTSASEEERLNRMASDQRVYILSSDIQASNEQIKTQVTESSF